MKMVLRGKERGISQFFCKEGLIDHLLVELGDGAGAIGIMVLDGKQRELQGGLPETPKGVWPSDLRTASAGAKNDGANAVPDHPGENVVPNMQWICAITHML
jgi:hypothetical protein